MNDTKPWYASVGVWGGVSTLLAGALGLLKFKLDAQLLSDLHDWLLSAITLAGGAAALWGRLRATRRIASTDPGGSGMVSVLLLLVVLLAVPALSGCATFQSPTGAYVAADRATFDAIAPEYRAYVGQDPSFTDEQRARRDRTVRTWELRLQTAEHPATAPALP